MKAEIVRLDNFGVGICYIDGKVTFVPKTVVGDIAEIEITNKKKKYNIGKLKKIIKPSEKRMIAKCPYFDICGGCSLQNISYEDGCNYKVNKVKEEFRRNGLLIEPVFIKNPNTYSYRNKITLKIINKKIGYFESSSHNLIEINKCEIVNESINKVISYINSWNITNGEIVIRCNLNAEILIAIKTDDNLNIDFESIKKEVKLAGVIVNDNLVYGESHLIEVINGLLFKISYDSFFQVNPYVASKLFELVGSNVSKDDKVLELYSGVGTLSLSAAKNALSVVGVEIVPNAVMNSIYNASLNKINNVTFLLNDATDAVKKIDIEFNKLIVDPPRAGLSKQVVEMILIKLPKQIIYVSCDMHTLIRDLNLLKGKYAINKLYTFDMFSYTYHVENMVVLELI